MAFRSGGGRLVTKAKMVETKAKAKRKPKASTTRSWQIVLSFYREDGPKGNFALNHYHRTKSEALKQWKEEGPSWVRRHPNFASLREVVSRPGKPVITTELDCIYSVGPFWDYGRYKRQKEEEAGIDE